MPDTADSLGLQEYQALRDTIRERGSVRLIVTVITFSAWAAAILTAAALFVIPLFGLIPLVVLAAGFEVIFAIHVGVERIGRYIQIHHEPHSAGARWERTAMQFVAPKGGSHALLPVLFIAAALLNLVLTALLSRDPEAMGFEVNNPDVLIYALVHILFLGRVIQATRYAATQRALDADQLSRLLGSR